MDGLVLGMETPVEDAGGLLGDLGGGDPLAGLRRKVDSKA